MTNSPNSSPELAEALGRLRSRLDYSVGVVARSQTVTPRETIVRKDDLRAAIEALSSKNELPSEIEADLHRLKTQAQVGPAAVTLIEKQAAAILSLQRRLDEAFGLINSSVIYVKAAALKDDMEAWLDEHRAVLNPKDTGQ